MSEALLGESEICDDFKETIQDIQDYNLIIKNTNVCLNMEEWCQKSKYIEEIHKQEYVYQ